MDVLIILVWTYTKYDIRHKWLMKYDSKKYNGIKAICGFPGQVLPLVLPSFHTFTECDTPLYMFRVG